MENNVKIKIRKMDISDIPFVYDNEIKIFGRSLGEKTLYNEILYNDLAHYYLAVIDNQRAGYIGSWFTLPNAEILNVFVLEQYQKRGVGNALLCKVIDLCKELDIIYLSLEVRESNLSAINFYKKLGFKREAIRKGYYENKEDALLMVLDIGGKK
ncbi:ribosomal-protein-alanine N-acetyltransferase [Candidatus Izimaplasma bacterium ZiA1]|uniref:ribosomal protein S18-alanine N-acetyltransferase n=1 Tax=Candidatus Izimoplasma sp. ZiA1 TaxID=2024899 RepID=UPI000BAA7B1A|nr:ribosomal-protein-alanine N-acetyltransferase [Candidatus Izimaplasma bacterium ZiA1]